MKLYRLFGAAALYAAVLSWVVFSPATVNAQSGTGAAVKTIMTAVPKKAEEPPPIRPSDVKVKVNGRSAEVDDVTPLRGDHAGLQLVVLIDSSARESLGQQMKEIASFVKALPPTTQVAIAYMVNGRAVFEQPFTTNKELALRALHLPGGTVGSSASPYFCISELAKNWPSRNSADRREVIAITDGIDPYEVRYDPEDPYVRAAIHDAVRNGVVVDAIYWHNQGIASRIGWLASGGQSLLSMVTEQTGGKFYYQGFGNPVSFRPYFQDLSTRLENQYELDFMVPAKTKSQIASLNVKLAIPDVKMNAPQLVVVPGS
ncbi:MAG TPA: hypothetical protein VME86_08095 [Acidobacteriaceae bacterium]|nr:hypothetical protein [Acidobacteriaceae bacterium]